MIKNQSMYALAIILLFCLNAHAQMSKIMLLHFENKNQIIEWGKKEFGYTGDSISIDVKGKPVFILFGDYYSGVQKKTIFVFLWRDKKEWELLCIRHTNTSKVKVDLNTEGSEIVFKAKSGKTLMTLPFEAINLDSDKSEK
jgi:hypothetical protein